MLVADMVRFYSLYVSDESITLNQAQRQTNTNKAVGLLWRAGSNALSKCTVLLLLEISA